MQLGLKLWSTNSNFLLEAKRLYEDGIFNYIELYTVPGSFDEYSKKWKNLSIPIEIHGPHIKSGMNLSRKELRKSNLKKFFEVRRFADLYNSESIILHPGLQGELNEVVLQLKMIRDTRIVIENMPALALDGRSFCIGSTYEEMELLSENTSICLDIGHAIYAANYYGENGLKYIKKINDLKPTRYHFMDGDWKGLTDKHLNLGLGDFPLKDILHILDKDKPVSIETNKKSNNKLYDFENDVMYLKELFSE